MKNVIGHPLPALIPFLLIVLLMPSPACGETRYVTDQLIVTMRAGQGSEFRILDSLRTGTAVEIIEEGDPYVKVKNKEGQEGYILGQYLVKDPPKALQADRLRKDIDRLTAQLREVEAEREALQAKVATQQLSHTREMEELVREKTAVEEALDDNVQELLESEQQYEELTAISGNVTEIAAERDSLKESQDRLQSEINRLEQEKATLQRKEALLWFLAGAGVLLIGWMIGKKSRRRPGLL